MSWKNLHFRPPILKTIGIDRVSEQILIRTFSPDKTYIGRIALRSNDDSFYHMIAVDVCGEFEETLDPDPYYEWTEVPE